MRSLKNIMVTGGAGFIGSNFINYLFGTSASGQAAFMDSGFTGRVVNVDCLTYAGNLENLSQVDQRFGSGADEKNRRYFFEKVDICDRVQIERILKESLNPSLSGRGSLTTFSRSLLNSSYFLIGINKLTSGMSFLRSS